LDETNANDKKKIKARERNSLAMAYLLSAFKAQADSSMAYEAMEEDDGPGGLAYKVVEQLLETYINRMIMSQKLSCTKSCLL
jgi:hypothetical protein